MLIDGDNIASGLADALFAQVAKLGKVTIRRVYSGSAGINDWRDKAKAHGVSLRETMPGKNSTDMELAIDAMDLLHRGKLDGYCIVSSDRDFAPLARRLREDGVQVFGFGTQKAAASLLKTWDQFFDIDRPKPAVVTPKKSVAPPNPKAPSAGSQTAKLMEAKALLLLAFERVSGDEWVTLTSLLSAVRVLRADFSPKTYGAAKPITLVRRTLCFDDEVKSGTMMVRKKQSAAVAKAA